MNKMITNGKILAKAEQATGAADLQEGTPSDSEVAKAARLALRHEKVIAPDFVRVKVSNGWVTLSGELDDTRCREHIVQVIEQASGARGVSNLILIRSHLPTVESIKVQEAIEHALERQAEREAQRIGVTIDQGTVVLTGDVRSWTERCAVVGAAGHAPGVRSVTDHLHLKSPA